MIINIVFHRCLNNKKCRKKYFDSEKRTVIAVVYVLMCMHKQFSDLYVCMCVHNLTISLSSRCIIGVGKAFGFSVPPRVDLNLSARGDKSSSRQKKRPRPQEDADHGSPGDHLQHSVLF